MRYKAITFILTFIVSLVLIKSSFNDVNLFTKEQLKNNVETQKHKQMSSKSQWSEKKQHVKGAVKFDEPNKFLELHRMIRTRANETKPSYKMNYQIEELKKAKARISSLQKGTGNISAISFVERGPANVGGRTRGIHVDPDDATRNTWFVASVGGGVWKTDDAGTTWEIKTPDFPNLSMSYFGVSPANTDVIYVGTGEGFGNIDGIPGNGIFKSTDHGETWTQLPNTINSNFTYVNRLVVDPDNENIVIAATSSGIYKSTDGGANWVETYDGNFVEDMVSNPLNFSTLYATQNGSGVLKSTDAGNSWVKMSKGIAGAGRLEIAIAPTDTNRLFVSAETATSTIFMTVNGADSWMEVPDVEGSTFAGVNYLNGQGWYDNAIAVHPYDENTVFYAGIDVWKATVVFDSIKGIVAAEENGTEVFLDFLDSKMSFLRGGLGTSQEYWGEDLNVNDDFVDIEVRFGPGITQKAHMFENYADYIDFIDVPFQVWDITNNKQLAVCYNDLRKNDGYDLSVTRGDEIFIVNVDYDSVNPDANLTITDGLKYKNIYVLTPKNLLGVAWDPSTHPESNIRILSGSVPVVSKIAEPVTDGYSQYGQGSDIHVDQHELVMVPMNEGTGEFKIINSNDGGVSYSNNGGTTWLETDQNGYNTSQFYGADKKPGANEYFGGMQDNGTWQSAWGSSADATTEYDFRIGGDGYETSWNYDDPNKLIGGSQYNRFWKSVDGGNTFYAANKGFPNESGWGNGNLSPFVSKIAKSNSDPDLLFTITRAGVWRSDDFGEYWRLSPISNVDAGGAYFSMAQVAISIANPQIVWAASYIQDNTRPNVSKDGGFTFSAVNNYTDVVMGRISGLDTHPTDEATAYLTFSFADAPKILRTTNYGQTWEDISGFGVNNESSTGFPDVAVYGVAVMPYNTDIIWAATDIGIVESIDNGASWHLLDSDLPAVSIWEIKIVNDQVVLATHGRGIWSATLPELSGYEPPVAVKAPRINGDISVGTAGITINASLRSVYDSTNVIVDGKSIKTIINSQPEDVIITAAVSEAGTKTVYLKSYKDGKTFRSSSTDVFVFEVLEAQQGYYTSFNEDDGAFVLDGMSVQGSLGFSSGGLQSPHDYATGKDYFAILKTPIIVAETDAILSYKDVAIIEPGDPGTVFGDEEFWDYVVVEGSKGSEWIPLLDGYDARSDAKWLTAYNNVQMGDESMFKSHNVNLLDKFEAGDTVLIRFRLFSDAFVVGWGWLVDDLVIQGQFVDVENENTLPAQFALNQNYPNPFNPSTKISYALPSKSRVSIKIFNNIGQLVETLFDGERNPGFHDVTWNAKVASGVYYYTIKAGDFVETKKMVLLK
ncbi:MAG: T9SS type A sorting domain-containing protein [Ignavibacteriales bacterium]|nr:T9SS type A sorting domain-containing protein [Ignavibacteriales bacterium]MCB9218903.1 T9SS type A sorting domain-containing protein [Ignavibacteriales bacterium]